MADEFNEDWDATKKTFYVWVEYLKRSKKYPLACQWFKEAFEADPYLQKARSIERIGKLYFYHVPQWVDINNVDTIKAVMHAKVFYERLVFYRIESPVILDGNRVDLLDLLTTYELVGDVHQADNTFEIIWNRIEKEFQWMGNISEVSLLEEERVLSKIFCEVQMLVEEEILDALYLRQERDVGEILKIVKRGFKKYLRSSRLLYTVATCPVTFRGKNRGQLKTDGNTLKEQFSKMINDHKPKLYDSLGFKRGTRHLVMKPTAYNWEQLRAYLSVYDDKNYTLAKDDPCNTWKYEKNSERRYGCAVKIIKNVEYGIFPGKYAN